MSNFNCPYCGTRGCADLTGETPERVGLLVCSGCAGYVLRSAGQWHPISYEGLAPLVAKHGRAVIETAEANRISLVHRWLSGQVAPPTIFATVMAEMVRRSGFDVCRWKGDRK